MFLALKSQVNVTDFLKVIIAKSQSMYLQQPYFGAIISYLCCFAHMHITKTEINSHTVGKQSLMKTLMFSTSEEKKLNTRHHYSRGIKDEYQPPLIEVAPVNGVVFHVQIP